MSKGKVAFVTGPTSGIGLGIARALAAAGADLMINGFGEAAAIDKLRREIAAAHGARVASSRIPLLGAAAQLSGVALPWTVAGSHDDMRRRRGRPCSECPE
jgi:NAD(P)-dependent dehydrogenase (short-subunit alcohol dehydrogenase family)